MEKQHVKSLATGSKLAWEVEFFRDCFVIRYVYTELRAINPKKKKKSFWSVPRVRFKIKDLIDHQPFDVDWCEELTWWTDENRALTMNVH